MSMRRAATESELKPGLPPPVTLSVDYESADDFVVDCAQHASSGAMYLSTDQALDAGTSVRLLFGFPGLRRPVACAGTVTARGAGRGGDESGTQGPGLTIELDDDGDRERLARAVGLVRARDPGVVARLVRVLVVEDNPHVAQLIRTGLQGSGKRAFGEELTFGFRLALNGCEAMDLLHSERFDAVILDIYLPILDGVHVISRMRADRRLRDVPVIAVSAGGEGACSDALRAGADRFVHKPMRLRDILDAMRELIQLDG